MLDGHATERGFDPLDLPVDRFCNWVYAFVSSRLDEMAQRRFDMALSRPGPGETEGSGEWSEEAMTADWDAFAADFHKGAV